jgi:hypothetical protein
MSPVMLRPIIKDVPEFSDASSYGRDYGESTNGGG